MYLFAATVPPTIRQRRFAVVLTICGSGMVLGAAKYGMAMFMADEVNTFALLFAAPHLMLGLCALLLALR